MLELVIGRAGSGKSDYILRRIAEERQTRRQVLLVPEHTSHEAELDVCRRCGATASRDTEVLSFQSLGSRVLSQTGGLSDFTLDNGGKILTMRRCLRELEGQLKVFGRPSQRSAFLRQLTALIDEFYAYDIAPETLYERVEDIQDATGDKLRDIALIFAAYDGKLRGGEVDERSRMQKLCDHLEESRYLDGADVYVDGFSFFNRLEERVLAYALRRCHSVTVTLLGDRYNDGLFQNALQARGRLERLARREGTQCTVRYLENKGEGALSHLERRFFGLDIPYEGEDSAEKLAVYEAANPYSEVEYVSAAIRRLLRQGVRCRDIGVAARNMEVYGPLLEMIFRRDRIPAYLSRRSDILEKPVLTMLLSAVDAVTGGFEYEDMFRYLKTEMADITASECDLLENYVIRWEIHGTMWLREGDWTANPDGYGLDMTEERRGRLERINLIRQKVARPLRALAEGLNSNSSAKDKGETLYRFAAELGVPQRLQQRADDLMESGEVQQAEEYAQLWQIFCDVLDQFVTLLGDTPLSGEEFARLLRLVLAQYSVGTIPATLDQVKISEITRNDRHRVPYLFLLGANDHVLPTVDRQGGILDSEARLLLQQRELPLSDAGFDALDNEMQNIYACLVQPTEYLHISYPLNDNSGASLRPSFVVSRVLRLFPQIQLRREDGSYRRELPATALPLAAQDEGIRRYFEEKDLFPQVMAAMERSRCIDRGRLSPGAVSALYGQHIAMSASRMDRANSCHFSYFMRYGLRAQERRSAGFEAPEVGTFLHYLLENVTRDVMERGGYGQVSRQELRRLVGQYTEHYAANEIDDYANKSARFRYLFERLKTTAYAVMENMADELEHSDFVPLAFELSFGGKNGDLPAITVQEGNTTLSVSGKVDRVDGWIHDDKLYLRVVDYKTGKKAFDLSDVRYGLGIQMLLYLFALKNSGEAYFRRPIVPAGVLYHPARNDILRMDRNTPEEKIAETLRRTVRRSGLVLSDPQVLQAMEHSALESPCYLPITARRGGQLSGSLASVGQLGYLGRHIDTLLRRMAQEIGGGNIDADPYSRSPQENACTHCAFAAACGFDPRREEMRRLKKTDNATFWQMLEETGEEGDHGSTTDG